jgi:hypothetical protein
LIGIKAEIIQCSPAYRVRVLILRERFGVPGYGIAGLGDSPLCTAVTLAVKRPVVCPGGVLRRRVKADVTYVNSGSQGYAEGLNRPIQILVIERVLIVPHTCSKVCYFIAEQSEPIVTRIRLDLGYRCTRYDPCHYGRLHPHGCSGWRKGETSSATDQKLTPGSVVVHVAFPRMRLAPAIFVWGDVLCFSEIARALIEVLVQVIDLNDNPVRHAVVRVTTVVVRVRRIRSGERIDPGARTEVWSRIEVSGIGVGASRA